MIYLIPNISNYNELILYNTGLWFQFIAWVSTIKLLTPAMEQLALKGVNNCLNININSYLETSGGQSYNLYLNVVHFFNTSVN
jgi:hypothetical protein